MLFERQDVNKHKNALYDTVFGKEDQVKEGIQLPLVKFL